MALGESLLLWLPHPCGNAVRSFQVCFADRKAKRWFSNFCDGAATATPRPSTAVSRFLTAVSPTRRQPRHAEQQQPAAAAAASTFSLHPSCCDSPLRSPQIVDRGTGSNRRSSGGTRIRSNSCSGSSGTSNVDVSSCHSSASNSSKMNILNVNRGTSQRNSARTASRNGNPLVLLLLRLLPLAIVTALLFFQQSAAEGDTGGEPSEIEPGGQVEGEKRGIKRDSSGGFREAPPPLARLKPTPARENFTDAASDLFDCVEQLAFTLQHPELSRVHLVACMLEIPGDTTIPDALKEAGGNAETLRKEMHDILIRMPLADTALAYGEAAPRPELRDVVVKAWRRAAAEKRQSVGVQDLIAALLECNRFSARLQKIGADVEMFKSVVDEAYRSHTIIDEEMQGKKKTPEWLNAFGVRLTDLARENKIGKVLERDEEIAEMQAILSRMTKPNCMLVGEPGVGKTALVEGLAHLIVNVSYDRSPPDSSNSSLPRTSSRSRKQPQQQPGPEQQQAIKHLVIAIRRSPSTQGQVSEALLDTEIYSLNVGALVSGSAMRGEFERRMKALLDYVTASDRRSILFVDEIHMLMGAGKSDGPMDAANLLKPALARGQIRVIGATTRAEYRRYVEKDTAFARRFTVVEVSEPSEAKTVVTLRGLREGMQEHHGLTISDEALEAAARLANRYIRERHLPDKAIDLLDSACSLKKVRATRRQALEAELASVGEEEESLDKKPSATAGEERTAVQDLKEAGAAVVEQTAHEDGDVVTAEDVACVISNKTGIAVHNLTESDKQKILRLPHLLRSRVYGQDEAVHAVASAVMRSRAGLAHRRAPVGTFLFLGPPGVGKTELAKALAMALYSDEKALIRLDMSEFSEAHTATRLIGSPPGYVNHEEGGQLTEAVRARPYSVVLLDELENAHPNVFPYLLQLLDEGRLTDSRGVTVDFRNCVIIATSNIGSQQIIEAYEKAGGDRVSGHSSIGIFDDVNEQLLLNAEADSWQASRNGVGRQLDTAATDSTTMARGLLGRPKRKTDYKAAIRKQIIEEAGRRFKHQVVNRMKVVLFDPLDTGKLRNILRVQENELAALFKEQQIEFEMNDSARNLIVARACSNSTGARDLQRYFEDFVAGPLSPWLLAGRLLPGMRVVVTTSPAHQNSFIAQTCTVDLLGRCLPGSRRARVLSTIDPQVL